MWPFPTGNRNCPDIRPPDYALLIRCPYCNDAEFPIGTPQHASETTSAPQKPEDLKGAELEVLPYARDVRIFDPPSDKRNSEWSRIGEDFYRRLSWDRSLGILKTPPGMKIWYCVAKCPECQKLMDVFFNETA